MNKELIRAEFKKVGFEVGFCKDGNMVGRMIKTSKCREIKANPSKFAVVTDAKVRSLANSPRFTLLSQIYPKLLLNDIAKNENKQGNLRSEFVFGLGRIWR